MNILPKKKWHVRTKENIQRVRRDEAKAAEADQRELERQIQVENERRMNMLRKQADARMQSAYGMRSFVKESGESSSNVDATDTLTTNGHVNFFEDLEREERKNLGSGNQEYEKEKEQEKNEWEKKMGILVHLGDGSNELDKKKEWYEKLPKRGTELAKPERWIMPQPHPVKSIEERSRKVKKEKKKKRKHDKRDRSESERSNGEKRKRKRRHSPSSSDDDDDDDKRRKKKRKKEEKEHNRKSEADVSDDEEKAKKARLMALREQRIRREREEASRTFALLHPEKAREQEKEKAKKAPKYNSMFNPHLAR